MIENATAVVGLALLVVKLVDVTIAAFKRHRRKKPES